MAIRTAPLLVRLVLIGVVAGGCAATRQDAGEAEGAAESATGPAGEAVETRALMDIPEELIGQVGDVIGPYIQPPPMRLGSLGDDLMLYPSSPVDEAASAIDNWKTGELRAVPIPIVSPMLGIGAGFGLGYLFHPSYRDRAERPTLLGLGGFLTSKGSWLVAAGLESYLDQGRWRVLVGGGAARLRYDYYGIGFENGDNDVYVPFEQEELFLFADLGRRVAHGLYVGPRIKARDTTSRVREANPEFPDAPPPGEDLETRTFALGIHVYWDTRDDLEETSSGFLADFTADFYDDAIGSDVDYRIYTAAVNGYFRLNVNGVLATRVFGRFAYGDVPFYDLSLYGREADLRGYTTGRWRDKMMFAVQAEYRHRLSRVWGLAAFAGVGALAPEIDGWKADELLPSIGVGVRYQLPLATPVRVRLDLAAGRESVAVYLGIGEAF